MGKDPRTDTVREALRESEDRYQSLFAASLDAVLLTMPDGRTLAANPAACRMFLCSEEELCQLGRAGVVDETDPRLPAALRIRDRMGRFQGELTFVRRDGSKFPGELSSSVFTAQDGSKLTCTVIRDVSWRKNSETVLRERESFTRAVLDNLPLGIAVNSVDPDVRFEYMNDHFPRLYRTTREKLAGPDSFWAAVYEDPVFREEIRRRILADCASGDPERMQWEDIPIVRRGEATRFVSARNIPVPGAPLMISTVWDVTQIKRAEEALAGEATRRRILVEQSRDGIVVLDPEGRVFEANRRYAEMLGYSPEEVLRLHIWDWDVRWSPQELLGMLKNVGPAGDHFETQHRRKDGSVVDVEISTNGAEIGGQKLVFCVCRDISERKKTEKQMTNQLKELKLWYAATLDREERVIELKREVDILLAHMGEKPRYGGGSAPRPG